MAIRLIKKHVEMVPGWQKCWKWASIQISTVGLIALSAVDVLQSSFSAIPPHILEKIPHGSNVAVALFALNIAGRLIRIKPKVTADASE